MPQDSVTHFNYFLSLDIAHKAYLGSIRHWQNLKIGIEANLCWVKDFSHAQIDSLEVKSIPFKQVFYAQEGKLFLQGSLLPHQNIPSLLWSPIERGLPVHLPPFNYNFFGIDEKMPIRLLPSENEREGYALLTTIEGLGKYLYDAPAIRVQKLDWLIINDLFALIFGIPLLPIQGNVFWRKGNFLIPVGFDFELYALTDVIAHLVNPTNNFIVVWNEDSSYFLLDKQNVQSLSLGSFRQSTVATT